jgi:hypothetical protein
MLLSGTNGWHQTATSLPILCAIFSGWHKKTIIAHGACLHKYDSRRYLQRIAGRI